jgi:hypothetical protein
MSAREAAMYPMSMSAAHQLVSDRRAAHEATANRHRLRRLFSRRAVEAQEPAPVSQPTLVVVPCGGGQPTTSEAERTVA